MSWEDLRRRKFSEEEIRQIDSAAVAEWSRQGGSVRDELAGAIPAVEGMIQCAACDSEHVTLDGWYWCPQRGWVRATPTDR